MRPSAPGILSLSALLVLASCHPAGVEYRPGRVASKLPAASVVASSNTSYRLIISPKLRDAPSRLWAVHVRIETFDDTPLRIDAEGAHLILADGTRAHPLDQPRVEALLKRTEIGAGDLSYVPPGTSRHPTGGLSASQKKEARKKILASPFVAGEVTRSRPIEGYMVVDAKQELSSLEGAVIEVVATRINDGAFVRRIYRFPASDEKQAAAERQHMLERTTGDRY